MLDVHDLKTRARRREAAGHPDRALELYQVALRESRTGRREGTDPGLCVRIADLHVEQDQMDEALDYYRTAADGFADQGLLPNAIAVAHKILQLYPDQVDYHHLLAELHMEVGHVGEARTHLLQFLEAMRDAGRPEDATEALEAFLGRTRDPEMAEIGDLLVEEARETAESMPEPEPEPEPEAEPEAEAEAAAEEIEEKVEEEPAASTEPEAEGDADAGDEPSEQSEEASAGDGGAATAVAAPETEAEEAVEEESDEDDDSDAPTSLAPDLESGDAAPDPGTKHAGSPSLRERLSRTFSTGDATPPSGPLEKPPPTQQETEPAARKAEPEAPTKDEEDEGKTGAGSATETGKASGATVEAPVGPLGEAAELEKGLEILEELLELAPRNIDLRRRKIVYARRLGSTENLHEAYLELGNALSEEGSRRAARIAYEQVLALDPENAKALSGIARLDVGELEEKRKQGEDAGASNRTRRMSTAADQRARQKLGEILWAEFEESVRQLPWLDGATQTFQAAGTEFLPPVEAYEMLGRYLMAREKYEDAVEVLSLATGISDATEEELVDVFYYLAQAHERLGHGDRAAELYDRVAEVDEDFRVAWEVIPDGEE